MSCCCKIYDDCSMNKKKYWLLCFVCVSCLECEFHIYDENRIEQQNSATLNVNNLVVGISNQLRLVLLPC